MVRGRPVNSEGRHNRSASDVRSGRAADGVGAPPRPADPTRRPPLGSRVPPDDRHTAVIPSVRDDTPRRCATRSKPSRRHSTAPRRRSRRHRRAPPRRPPRWWRTTRRGRPAACPPWSRSTGSGSAAGCTDVGRPDRAADRDVRDGLPDRRRAQTGRYPHQPGLDDPGQRRQRTRQNRSARRQSCRCQHRPDTGACARRGDGRRGPRLLLQPGLLVLRLRPGCEEQHLRRRHRRAARRSRSSTSRTRWWVRHAHGLGGVVRKAKELVISTKMSSEWSKDQVLQSYLNIIYFGRGAYGIGALPRPTSTSRSNSSPSPTARCWPRSFSGPPALDPAVNPDGAAERWNWVLDGMVEIGALSPTDRAAQVFPPTVPPEQARNQNQTTGPNGLIERQVQKELLDLFDIRRADAEHRGPAGHHHDRPEGSGGRRRSGDRTLDGQDPDMRAAVVSIDPKTGGVKAYLRRDRRPGLRLRTGRAADGFFVQGVRVGGRARAGHRPGLPGGQLTASRSTASRSPTSRAPAAAPATSPKH